MEPAARRWDRRRSIATVLREHVAEDSGFVLAYSALILTSLLSLGGFAVDVGNWYLQAQHLQRAADSAALAGAVYLPDNVTTAKSTAATSLGTNSEAASTQSIEQRTGHPTQLQVAVTRTVPNYFVSLLGFHSITLTRQAIGEYRPYVPMGSPSNVLGQEPDQHNQWQKPHDRGLQDWYWLNISGGASPKTTGDRWNSGNCSNWPDRCTSQAIPTGNLDYTGEQTFIVKIPSDVAGTMAIEAFDPIFANVGDTCDHTNITTNNQQLRALDSAYQDNTGDPRNCTGDNRAGTAGPTSTRFEVWTPKSSATGSVRVTTPGCAGRTFTGIDEPLYPLVNPASSSYSSYVANSWRKWVRVCTLYVGGSMPAGDYILKVTTPSNLDGLNRYALRIGMLDGDGTLSSTMTDGMSLYSDGKLVVYANTPATNMTFFLARLHQGAAGKVMLVTLYDIGDAAGGADLTVLPPQDAKVDGKPFNSFSDCTFTPPGQTAYQNTSSGCEINNISQPSYNGRIVQIKVPVPTGYTCDDENSIDGCWTRMQVHYAGSGGTGVQDTTSWQVSVDGAPVRLVVE